MIRPLKFKIASKVYGNVKVNEIGELMKRKLNLTAIIFLSLSLVKVVFAQQYQPVDIEIAEAAVLRRGINCIRKR